MDLRLPFTPAVKRLITGSALLALALTWFADIALLTMAPDPWHPATNWLPVLVTGPLTILAVGETRFSPPLLPRIAAMVAMSLALSGICIAVPQTGSSWGALETAGLLGLLLRTAARTPRPATAAASAAALSLTVLVLPARTGSWSNIVAGDYVLTVVLAIVITLGCAIRAMEARRRRAVTDVRQAERLALARDLHDLIAHHMTGIIVQAHAATAIYPTAPDKVEPILRNIAQAGTETLESMRRLVRVLREDNHTAVRPGDLLSELAELTANYSTPAAPDAAPATARLEATAAARTARISPEVEISAYRVAQEALTNVRRHAPGARAEVRLDADSTWLAVSISNTKGSHRTAVPPGGQGGFGLIGLRERVEALDGALHSGPLPDGGWEVRATFRLRAPSAAQGAATPADPPVA
ncbi:Signal transduction histidine kinase [Streptomyces sp. LamerLS-316]|uniref:sensor histidine kinase n=1 Tax=unclassified Streptomyces TaxID=2593676 RepID=UPI000823B845|nr:histidine kinase [Streptomyces sp. LamerLS-316]MYQ42428.1 two-component sensor histidine kinase [Streptomyces sp. SID4921]SCK53647.1 Signal transduction histidine kinase [Streptomyces sp. LamerLS-316]